MNEPLATVKKIKKKKINRDFVDRMISKFYMTDFSLNKPLKSADD
jgi:hypothetical protein